jgi:hypothetical protein
MRGKPRSSTSNTWSCVEEVRGRAVYTRVYHHSSSQSRSALVRAAHIIINLLLISQELMTFPLYGVETTRSKL